MANPRNLSVHPAQGQQLPAQWRQQAPERAAQAEAAYLDHIQNAWKRPAQTGAQATIPAIRACRLTADSAAQARKDSELRLIGRDGDWELWQDAHGVTIRRRINNGTVR